MSVDDFGNVTYSGYAGVGEGGFVTGSISDEPDANSIRGQTLANEPEDSSEDVDGNAQGATETPWLNQKRKGPYDDDVAEFIKFYFGKEFNELSRLAAENKSILTFWIDGKFKYTDAVNPGFTVPVNDGKGAQIVLSVATLSDAQYLYIILAHELVHARNLMTNQWNEWYFEYGSRATADAISEYFAYKRGAELEDQFGIDIGEKTGLSVNRKVLPPNFKLDGKDK